MNKRLIFKTLFLSSVVFLHSPLQAEDAGKAKKESKTEVKPVKEKKGFLAKFDTNNDGKVSKDEFKKSMGKRFQRMDFDQSGSVSIEELQRHAMKQQNKEVLKKIAKHDSDKDGSINIEEFLAPRIKRLEEKFAELDKNNDGKLGVDEIPSKKGKAPKKATPPPLFPNIDTNKDNQISDEEKNAAFDRLFNRLDQNKDQIVTVDEVKSRRKKHAPK